MKNLRLFVFGLASIAFLVACDSDKKSADQHAGHEMAAPDSTRKTASAETSHDGHEHGGAAPATAQDLGEVDLAVKNQINGLLTEYLELKNALVATNDAKAKSAAASLIEKLEKVDDQKMTDDQKAFFHSLHEKIKTDAEHITEAGIDHQREHFSSMSNQVFKLVKSFHANQKQVYYEFCPMAFENKGAYWLSETEQIKNPYFGEKMISCGSVKETLAQQ
jgi:hypothetical protein